MDFIGWDKENFTSGDDVERYELIKSHLRTRAVENATKIITVNTIKPYQTAPIAIFDSSGIVIDEMIRNTEGLLIHDFEHSMLGFGQQGIKVTTDILINK